ncbi:MAG: hypothetical protein LBD16_06850, partial [Oscillospiraceae bacterium]|nr:hypothetical protein [Oscillospiraceae bacterium]
MYYEKNNLGYLSFFLVLAFGNSTALASNIIQIDDDRWEQGWGRGGPTAMFAIDYSTRYGTSLNSKTITNNEFNHSWYSKEIAVEPNTKYRVTVWAKIENYANNHENGFKSGVLIANGKEMAAATAESEIYAGSEWKQLSMEFNSEDEYTTTIYLLNGYTWGTCEGTAYFSDIRIERLGRVVATNEWHFLALIYRNLDVTVDGKHATDGFNDTDVARLYAVIDSFIGLIPEISGGRMAVGRFDTFVVDEPITKVELIDAETNSYHLPAECNPPMLDYYLDSGEYDQVFM